MVAVEAGRTGSSITVMDISFSAAASAAAILARPAAAPGDMIAAHADWSIDPRKRWITWARRVDGQWRAAAPAPVGELAALLPRLLAPGLPVALGLDLPLGVPREFAAGRPEPGFAAFLRGLADSPDFFRVSAGLETVSPARPFYPARGIAGMTRAAHAAALGLRGPDGPVPLVRPRHRRAPGRRAAVLDAGGQPVGQGGDHRLAGLDRAGAGPTGRRPIRLWPFEGGLHALLAPGVAVLAEVYPAEALRHCGLKLAGSKRAAGAAPGAGAGAAGGDGGARGAARRRAGGRGRRPASAPMPPGRTASTPSSACSG